jgi:hypothetical protein
MPVLLQPQEERAWLASDTPLHELLACLQPYPAELMRAYQVSTLVNSTAVDGPELTTPERERGSSSKPALHRGRLQRWSLRLLGALHSAAHLAYVQSALSEEG